MCGEGDIEKNRGRAASMAKNKVLHACKSVRPHRMLTLTTRQAVFNGDVFPKMTKKFIRLACNLFGISFFMHAHDFQYQQIALPKKSSKKYRGTRACISRKGKTYPAKAFLAHGYPHGTHTAIISQRPTCTTPHAGWTVDYLVETNNA